jgi:hypothetical protein
MVVSILNSFIEHYLIERVMRAAARSRATSGERCGSRLAGVVVSLWAGLIMRSMSMSMVDMVDGSSRYEKCEKKWAVGGGIM